MIDNRHLRFTSIAGIERKDLPIAAEIWLSDVVAAGWVTRDMIKLSTIFTKYIKSPNLDLLSFTELERKVGMAKQQVAENCHALMLFGALDSSDCDGPRLKATLNLSFLQRLRVIEVRSRFAQLKMTLSDLELPWHCDEFRQTLA